MDMVSGQMYDFSSMNIRAHDKCVGISDYVKEDTRLTRRLRKVIYLAGYVTMAAHKFLNSKLKTMAT